MRLIDKHVLPVVLVSIFSLAACGGSDDDDDGGGGPDPVACDLASATDYPSVVNSLDLPTSVAEASSLALDLDGDNNNDNKLGELLATLGSTFGIDLQTTVGAALNAGEVIILTNLRAEDLTRGCGSFGVFLGANPDPEPCNADGVCGLHLSGSASFELDAQSPTDTVVNGTIVGGRFALGEDDEPGRFELELDLIEGEDPIRVELIGAQVELSSISDSGVVGILGGAVTEETINNDILPPLAGAVNTLYQADCALNGDVCECAAGSTGATLKTLLDPNGDCVITAEEVQTSGTIQALIQPDLDLVGDDGEEESLSLGVSFSTVGATFTAP
ncbi:MAG: hypothetical protein AAGC55_23525 [Myxococcota bacterium]